MCTSDSRNVYDCVVIGGGISGLCAAKYLNEKKVSNILVLEADSRVGGRTYTLRNEKVSWVDLGGSYVGPNQSNILRIANELKIKTYKVFAKGNIVDYLDGKRFVFKPEGSGINAEQGFTTQLNNFMKKIDTMGKEIPADEPWNAPNAKKWDQITWREFVEKNSEEGWRHIPLRIADDVFCASPHECSLLFALWYIKLGKGTESLFGNEGGAQDSKFDGGAMQISEKIAQILGAQKVLLNKPVYFIDQTSELVRIKSLDGCEYTAKTVIIAIPPCMQNKIHFKPPLPALRNQLLQRFPMGTVMKCVLYYKTAFWREKGYSAAGTLYGEHNYLQATYDDTKGDGNKPAIACFIYTNKNRERYELPRDKRSQLICEDLCKLFDAKEALSPVHYEEYNWGDNQYCGGGYTGYCPPGCLTYFCRALRKPVNKLFFAGTETATGFLGYMDGAVTAGERAAAEVIQAMVTHSGVSQK